MVSITYCKSKTQAGEPIFKILAKLLTTTNTNNKKIDIVTWKVETRIGIICINRTNLLRQNKITHLCFIFSVSVSWPETTKEWGFYCMKKKIVIVSSFLFTSEIKNKVVKQHQLQTLWSIFFNQILSWSSFGGNNWFNICNICFWQWLEKLLSKTDDYSFLTSDLTTHSNYRTKRIQQYSHPEPHRTTSMHSWGKAIGIKDFFGHPPCINYVEKRQRIIGQRSWYSPTGLLFSSCGLCTILCIVQYHMEK